VKIQNGMFSPLRDSRRYKQQRKEKRKKGKTVIMEDLEYSNCEAPDASKKHRLAFSVDDNSALVRSEHVGTDNVSFAFR
jgi:hypothetical protein